MITTTKPVTKLIELTLNGFHGYQSHNVRATFTRLEAVEGVETPYGFCEGAEAGYDVTITESAARKFACTGDCTCGEGMPTSFIADWYDFDAGEVLINGNYPQR